MKRLVLAFLAGVALAACESAPHADLDRELKELTKDAKGKIEPLPQVKTYEAVPYAAFELPDPFGPAKIKLLDPKRGTNEGSGPQPDLTRPKEPLEAYPLESIKMVGTLQRDRQTWALVRADQGVYRVRIGNYLGQNFGVITKISESEISLKELIQDGTGDWSERVSSLLLQEAEAKR